MWSGIHQSLLPPFKISFTPMKGGGGGYIGACAPYSYASDSDAARICQ